MENFTLFRDSYQATSKRVLDLINVSTPTTNCLQLENVDESVNESEALGEILEIAESPQEYAEQFEILGQDDQEEATEDSSTAVNPHKCSFCPKSFRYTGSLYRHIKSYHEQVRHNCFKCKTTFTQRSSLRAHMKSLHNMDLESSGCYECTEKLCKKTFFNQKQLQKHLQTHVNRDSTNESLTTVPKPKYRKQCSTCGLFFKHIEEHKLTHQCKLVDFASFSHL